MSALSAAIRNALPPLVPAHREVWLSMPWPPSLNRLYRSVRGGVILSQAAKSYYERIGQMVLVERIPRYPLCGRLSVIAKFHAPDARLRDMDNLWKALLDSLVKSGVIADDHLIKTKLGTMEKPSPPDGFVTLRIVEMEGT